MAIVPLTPASTYDVLESGYYVGTVTAVTVVDHDADQYHDKPYKQLQWGWEIAVPDQEEKVPYTSWTSMSLNEKAKLPGLLRALCTEIPTQLDTDAMIGLSCRLNIEERVRDDGTTKNYTNGYAPIKRGAVWPAPAENGHKIISEQQVQKLQAKLAEYARIFGTPYPVEIADPMTIAECARIVQDINKQIEDHENIPF